MYTKIRFEKSIIVNDSVCVMSEKYFNDQPISKKLPKTAIMIRQLQKMTTAFFSSGGMLGRGSIILLFLMCSVALAQSQTRVTGKVTNEDGEGLPGATVSVKGTTTSTLTQDDGGFMITVNNLNAILEISFVGLDKKEVPLSGKSTVDVVLSASKKGSLSEVVVVGYGTQTRDKLTTSVSKVDNKVLENTTYTNVASALQGAVAGLRVQTISGQPGQAPRIILRGGTSINNPNGAAPLYIVDGVIRSAGLDDINADDIESMQVLKDAASTAIYGARGSNGVIIVTTKSGKSGRTNISYSYNLASTQATRMMEYASAADYVKYGRLSIVAAAQKNPALASRNQQATGFGSGNNLTENTAYTTQYLTDDNAYLLQQGWQSIPDPLDETKTLIFKETIYQDLIYQTGYVHNHNINVSGGNERATFNAGIGYVSGEGTAISTSYKRLSLNANGSLKVRDNLTINSRLLYSNRANAAVASIANVFYRAASLPGTAKYQFEDGSMAPGQNRSLGNPHYHLIGPYAPKGENTIERLTMSVGGHWDIAKGLSFDPIVSINKNISDNYMFNPAYLNGVGALVTSRAASSSYRKETQYQADGILSYIKAFSGGHNLDVKVGFSHFQRNLLTLSANGQGAATDLVPTLNASPTPTAVNGTSSDLVIQGVFSRIDYDYKSKYLLSLNARYDGASNLGDEYKFGFFPGVSVGWNLHREKFWNALPAAFSGLKLRASYGVNGNISGLSDFQSQGDYSVTTRYNGASAILANVMPNAKLQWEESKTLDVGFDLGLFNRRINIIADYYVRNTENLLTSVSLPPSSGYASIVTNLGALRNRGYEIELQVGVLKPSSAVQWNISFNAGYTKAIIVKLPDNGIENNRIGGEYLYDADKKDYAWKGGLQEGGRIGDMYAYKLMGVYATDEEAANSGIVDNTLSAANKTLYGGDAYFLDVDGNKIIDSRDKIYMGNPYPVWTGGITNAVSYKNLTLFTRFDFTTGHTIYNYAALFADGQLQGDALPTKDYIDKMWKKPGDITNTPRYVWQNQTQNTRPNSYYYQRGDFLAIREISLAYTLPKSLVSRLKLSNIRVNVTGNNLYYFTGYDGPVPEEGGQDNGHYPIPRVLSFGVNVSF